MKLCFDGLSDPGVVRSVNQDNFYIDPQGRYFIVADGMGGHAGGEEASKIATSTIKSCLDQYWDTEISSTDLLVKAIEAANQAILDDQKEHPERKDMGTTVVVLILREQPWCAHIGDSRLYRLRKSQLEQITQDHTWVSMALRAGDMTAEDAKVHPWRHVLSQCLGRPDIQNIEIQPLEILAHDRILICSDGLTEEVSDEMISSYLQKTDASCHEIAAGLIEEAKQAGGSDNITIVVLESDSDITPQQTSPEELATVDLAQVLKTETEHATPEIIEQ